VCIRKREKGQEQEEAQEEEEEEGEESEKSQAGMLSDLPVCTPENAWARALHADLVDYWDKFIHVHLSVYIRNQG